MVKKSDPSQKLIDAAFDLATSQSWSRLSMAKIASHANIPVAEALGIFPDRDAILDAVITRVDQAALNECVNFQDEDSIRDKLFALLMARLDALAPYRQVIPAVICDNLKTPLLMACRLPRLMKSMALMLEAASVSTRGPGGMIKTNGLALIFGSTIRVWLRDKSEDQAATMATLDRGLKRADRLVSQCGGFRRK